MTIKTKLTVPISSSNRTDFLLQARNAVNQGAQMLELRTDYLNGLSVDLAKDIIRSVRQSIPVPLIVTCRDEKEGGVNSYADELRLNVLIQAIQESVDYIDLEFTNFQNQPMSDPILSTLSASGGTQLILSAHNFNSPFDDLKNLYSKIQTACPEAIPKLVYTANHINDCFKALDLLHEHDKDIIVLCMGQAGLISRILAKKLNAMVSFASLDSDTSTAPGQLTIDQFNAVYRFSDSNPDTKLFGLISDSFDHSTDLAAFNTYFADKKLNNLYLLLPLFGGRNELFEFLNNLASRKWLGFRGLSIAPPHQQNALNYVFQHNGFIDSRAQKTGAADTLLITEQGKFSAFNTGPTGQTMAQFKLFTDQDGNQN